MSIRNINIKLNQIRVQLSSFGRKLSNDWSIALSALIAYYLLISLIPLIICIFSVTILIFGNDTYFVNITRDRLEQSFSDEYVAAIIDTLVKSLTKQAHIVFLISFIIAIFTSSCLFTGIDDVLTIIYRIREREIIKQYIHAIKMLLIFLIIMTVIIICLSIPVFLRQNETVYHFLTILLSGLFAFILFLFIYYYVPQRKMTFSKIWCGSLFAAIGLLILFSIFPLYVQLFMTNYVGQLGFIIITLLLFYLFGLLLVMGAQINAYFFDHIQPLSISLGNCICEFANHENTRLIDENSQSDYNLSTLTEGL